MSKKPAKKMMKAPVRKFPTAKFAAAAKFTTRPRKVKKFGFTPVAASAPTILSSSHLLPLPLAPVSVALSRQVKPSVCLGVAEKRANLRFCASYNTPNASRKQANLAHHIFLARGDSA